VQQQDGTFRDEAAARGVAGPAGGTGALFFDFDGDGNVDLLVGHVGAERPDRTIEGSPVRFYRNTGGGRFEDRTADMGAQVVTAASSLVAFDATGDGWLDVFVCGYGYMDRARNDSWVEATNGAPNFLLANRAGERFEDVTRAAGVQDDRWSYAAAAADFDRDGRQDLYVGNNFGSNRLWHNAGGGRFVDVAPALGVEERGNTMAVVWGDVDGDGKLDLYVVGPESAAGKRVLGRVTEAPRIGQLKDLFAMADGNALFLGTDDGFERSPFAAEARDAGWAFGTVLADLDLDGRADLFCVNGFVTGDLPEDT
jgi:enediyne biosynthesis protein E4